MKQVLLGTVLITGLISSQTGISATDDHYQNPAGIHHGYWRYPQGYQHKFWYPNNKYCKQHCYFDATGTLKNCTKHCFSVTPPPEPDVGEGD